MYITCPPYYSVIAGPHQASGRVQPATSARQVELGCGFGVTLFQPRVALVRKKLGLPR